MYEAQLIRDVQIHLEELFEMWLPLAEPLSVYSLDELFDIS